MTELFPCQVCERSLAIEDFYIVRRDGKEWRVKTCKDCTRRRVSESAARVVARSSHIPRKSPTRLTPGGMTGAQRYAFWDAFKVEAGCFDCGTRDGGLEFDHLPEFEKFFTIAEAMRRTGFYSDDEIASEVSKCEVVCRSCHANRTKGRLAA